MLTTLSLNPCKQPWVENSGWAGKHVKNNIIMFLRFPILNSSIRLFTRCIYAVNQKELWNVLFTMSRCSSSLDTPLYLQVLPVPIPGFFARHLFYRLFNMIEKLWEWQFSCRMFLQPNFKLLKTEHNLFLWQWWCVQTPLYHTWWQLEVRYSPKGWMGLAL